MFEPAGDQPAIKALRWRATFVGHHRHHGVDHGRITLVEHQEDRGPLEAKGPLGFDLVVEPDHRRGRTAPEYAPAGVEPLLEPGEGVGGVPLLIRARPGPQASLGDHPERALAADEQLRQVWARRCPRRRTPRADQPPIREGNFEAGDQILDLSVPCGVLARPPAGDPPADR